MSDNLLTSKNYYDNLSNDYQKVSQNKEKYLNAVDKIILLNTKKIQVENWLDVGAGDGVRSISLNKQIKSKLTLLDNSKILDVQTDLEKENSSITRIKGDIVNFIDPLNYDLVTCLWNVLGHVGNENSRIKAFSNMTKCLKKRGLIILDVNNRYNILNYGEKSVQSNIEQDILSEECNTNGYFSLNYDSLNTTVYIHNPFEIDKLVKNRFTELEIIEKIYINYDSGDVENSCFRGQLLYLIRKK